MLQVVVGHSCDPDSAEAIAEVLAQCVAALAGATPQAGLLFAAIDFDHAQILAHLHQDFPDLILIGGTTDGEMSSVEGFQQDSLTLLLFVSDTLEIRAGLGRQLSHDPTAATHQAITAATAQLSHPPQLCLAVPESLTTSAVAVLEGLTQALGPAVPIVGGLTGDRYRRQQTFQFFQTEVLSDSVPVLLFSGNLHMSCGVFSGWTPIGKKGVVTKATRNVVHEIDGQPARDFYCNYLGDQLLSTEYGLAVFEPGTENFYTRSPTSQIDAKSGDVIFVGDVPEQAIVQMTDTTRRDILAAAQSSVKQALAKYPGQQPAVALAFSCAGRRMILGPQSYQEYEMIVSCLPPGVPICGFYSYGELAPLVLPGQSHFHNLTLVTVLLGVD
jgi:hypothetical protein